MAKIWMTPFTNTPGPVGDKSGTADPLSSLGPSCKVAYLVRLGRHNTTDDGNGSDSESSQEKQNAAAAPAPEQRRALGSGRVPG